ncbi:MAG: spore coat protein CotJB [Roseburia sp.]|nr:spore coat protein CotJB [Ruminococcus sp.]MCM1154615.1 spore coat protein CotJB [Roseburia sp.]MCM1241700.1 spore coat protein CotJB [Roseburia sp.]
MTRNFRNEQEKLLHNIDLMGFVIVEMNEYLDTHPDDTEAIDYLKHYVRMKNQAMREYASKYEPLTMATADASSCKEWIWATSPMPWEGGCN